MIHFWNHSILNGMIPEIETLRIIQNAFKIAK